MRETPDDKERLRWFHIEPLAFLPRDRRAKTDTSVELGAKLERSCKPLLLSQPIADSTSGVTQFNSLALIILRILPVDGLPYPPHQRKRGQIYFSGALRGRPRGRMVRSRSKRSDNCWTQPASPNGSPVWRLRRIVANSRSSVLEEHLVAVVPAIDDVVDKAIGNGSQGACHGCYGTRSSAARQDK
jgi:hypothetical protein